MRDTFEGGPASRSTRWITKLQEYRFTVEHKPGATHCDADGVSRLVQLVASAMSVTQDGNTDAELTRKELKAWAARVKPGGVEYNVARDRLLTAYWQRQRQWARLPSQRGVFKTPRGLSGKLGRVVSTLLTPIWERVHRVLMS